jgi:hypothetical protein
LSYPVTWVGSKKKPMVLIIILSVLIGVLLFLLFSPFTLQINTIQNDFSVRWKGIGSARLLLLPEDLAIRMKIFFWHKDFYPLHPDGKKKKEKAEKKKPVEKKKRRAFTFRKMKNVLRSFHIRKFRMDIDTDNYATNAWLFPLCYLIDLKKQRVRVNFEGRNECILTIENRLFNMALAFLK